MDLVVDAVNRFRQLHGTYTLHAHDSLVSSYCVEHSKAMAARGELYHAQSGWVEVVGVKLWEYGYIEDVINQLVFDVLGNSPDHRSTLLGDYGLVAGGVFVSNGRAYITVRLK